MVLKNNNALPKIQKFSPIFAQDYDSNHIANPIYARYVDYDKIPIVKWRNIQIFMHGIKIIKSPNPSEKYFFIPYISQHYHFLVDSVAMFWYVKSKHPEVIPYVLLKYHHPINISDHPEYKKIKELGFEDNNIHIGLQTDKAGEGSLIRFSNLYSQSYDIVNPHALHQHDDGLYDILRNKYFDSLVNVKPNATKKYYLSRKNFSARPLKNENILEEYFMDKGYSVVYLEDLTYSEQADIFANADTVVTRSGSSLANMIFATQRTRIIDISDSLEYKSSSIEWKIMADKFNLNYINIYVGNTKDSRYIIKRLNEYIFNL